jgi:hypothetical protein
MYKILGKLLYDAYFIQHLLFNEIKILTNYFLQIEVIK